MRKKCLVILLTFLCVLGLVACSGSSKSEDEVKDEDVSVEDSEEEGTEEEANEEDASKEDGKYLVGFSGIDMENPYFITLEDTIREELEKQGNFELITENPSTDATQQANDIMAMINQGIDAIILSPVDSDQISSSIQALKDAGVLIVNVDTKVSDIEDVDAYIGSDNYKAGQLCAEDLIEKCPEGGKIAILESPTMNSVTERIQGFEDTIEESGIPFEVVARDDTQGELEKALEASQNILNANPDVVAIMCGNDQLAVGARTAANLYDGSGDIYIYGVDGSPDIKKELKKAGNQIAGTAAQSPITLGKDAADTVVKMLTGEEYEPTIYEDVFMINADNVDEYGTDDWQ